MRRLGLAGFCAVACTASSAFAGSHTWRFSELYSNSSGTIQFVELYVGNFAFETGLNGLQITTGTNTFTFPGNLTGPTTEKHLLLATSAFAALPGAPTPDYIIPANFFPPGGGFTIRYNPPANYDTNVVAVGAIPTDGVNSLQYTSFLGGNGNDTFTNNTPSNPVNYAGCTTEICDDGLDNDCNGLTDCADPACASAVPACIPTVSAWGVLALALLTMSAGSIMLRQRA